MYVYSLPRVFFSCFFTRSIRGLNMRMKRRKKNEALVVVVKPSIDRQNSNTGQKFHRISFSPSVYIFDRNIPISKKEKERKNNNNNKIFDVLYFYHRSNPALCFCQLM